MFLFVSNFFNLFFPVYQLEFQMTVKREQVCDMYISSLLPDSFILEEKVEFTEAETSNVAMLLLQV